MLPNNENTTGSTSGASHLVEKKYLLPFILITSLFFLWGLIHNINPILIAHLRKTFQLTNLQSSLVDSAVYIAYFLMAIPAGLVMKKTGYKTGVLAGLFAFAVGVFLFIPAANTHLYIFFLAALFIIASGLTFLETAANPYATILGPVETATQRLNLAQSFNGLAAFIAPLLGRVFILSDKSKEDIAAMSDNVRQAFVENEAAAVKTPFLILGGVLVAIAVIFTLVKLPEIKSTDEVKPKGNFFDALKHGHLRMAVIAQFFYVGAQVCVGSFFIVFASHTAAISDKEAATYLSIYGLLFMLGRFVGTWLMKYIKDHKLLAIYALANIALILVAILGSGIITIYALIGVGFFMSIMFPTIFALGLTGLGPDTKAGSSLIIMAIVGGAILPPVLGYISDITGNIQWGYIVPLICFGVIYLFGRSWYKPA